MNRRDMLLGSGAVALGFSLRGFPVGWASAPANKKRRVLFFTKSSGYEHAVIKRLGGELALAERVLTDLGAKHGFEVTATKDGGVFTPSGLASYDAFFFYTTGDLTTAGTDENPPMSAEGKAAFLEAIEQGKGFLGSHCASDTFHSPGERGIEQAIDERDPYIRMIGGEFVTHGRQQEARMEVADDVFPATKGMQDFAINDEWYALKNFAPDSHVLLVQQTSGMEGKMYHRPPYPATWARRHGKGRVFFTSMGHREDVWTNPRFQQLLLGALAWATGNVEADVTPNLESVTPGARELPPV